jgi:YegS/Rv2252/BmrU family lipid kinase
VRVRAILNPRAGLRTRGTRAAVEAGRPSWRAYAVSLTREPGHAIELAREAVRDGADVVIAVGGDGTVNEVARGLLGSRAALGIVPVGSGNGLARALELPLVPAAAMAALETAVPFAMDVGYLNERPFLNVAGVGFDAVVGHAFHEHGTRGGRRGFLGYLRLSLRELRSYRASALELDCGGERCELRPFVVTFANGPQYGSGAVVNPGAKLDDGQLEIVALEEDSVPRLVLGALRMFTGGVERVRGYSRRSAALATVVSHEPLAVHVDGDPWTPTGRLELRLEPLALRVLAPRTLVSAKDRPFAHEPLAEFAGSGRGAGVPGGTSQPSHIVASFFCQSGRRTVEALTPLR